MKKTKTLINLAQYASIHDAITAKDMPAVRQWLAEHPQDIHQYGQIKSIGGETLSYSTLDAAIKAGPLQILKLLIKKGADVNKRDEHWKMAALHFAIMVGNRKACRILVEAGADINLRGGDGNTPLHIAALEDQFELVKWLVESGADLSIKNNEEQTAGELSVDRSTDEIESYLREVKQVKLESHALSQLFKTEQDASLGSQGVEEVSLEQRKKAPKMRL